MRRIEEHATSAVLLQHWREWVARMAALDRKHGREPSTYPPQPPKWFGRECRGSSPSRTRNDGKDRWHWGDGIETPARRIPLNGTIGDERYYADECGWSAFVPTVHTFKYPDGSRAFVPGVMWGDDSSKGLQIGGGTIHLDNVYETRQWAEREANRLAESSAEEEREYLEAERQREEEEEEEREREAAEAKRKRVEELAKVADTAPTDAATAIRELVAMIEGEK